MRSGGGMLSWGKDGADHMPASNGELWEGGDGSGSSSSCAPIVSNGVLSRSPSGTPIATAKGARQQQWLQLRQLHTSAVGVLRPQQQHHHHQQQLQQQQQLQGQGGMGEGAGVGTAEGTAATQQQHREEAALVRGGEGGGQNTRSRRLGGWASASSSAPVPRRPASAPATHASAQQLTRTPQPTCLSGAMPAAALETGTALSFICVGGVLGGSMLCAACQASSFICLGGGSVLCAACQASSFICVGGVHGGSMLCAACQASWI